MVEIMREPMHPWWYSFNDTHGDLREDDVDVHVKAGGEGFDDEEAVG